MPIINYKFADGHTEELEVTIEFTKGAKSDMEPTTWCFRPTVDLY